MSSLKYSVVDAFTTIPFRGNSAAVIVLNQKSPALSDTTLQQIAAEFNLSETAFVTPQDASQGKFALRWFTPTIEAPLCGHATLATASVLFSSREYLPGNVKKIEFSTLSGVLTAQKLADGRIELELPAGETTAVDEELRRRVVDVVQRAFPADGQPNIRFIGTGRGTTFGMYMLVEVDGVDIENLDIQPSVFLDLSPLHRLVLVTQRGRSPAETFTSRVFAPDAGVLEDPVCGSAHCMLGPYWETKLKLDAAEMSGRQVSQRTGDIGVVWDREKGTCRLRGHSTLSAKGELYLPK